MPKKSWKRETAVALFLWLGYLVETKEPELVQILAFPVFTFGALSFGLSWYSPNGGMLKPPRPTQGVNQRSSQHSTREDEYTDSGPDKPHGTVYSEASGKRHQTDF
jgi:hypothetical protein